jgi:hypothetical protein
MKRVGPALLLPGAEEGVSESIHWRIMPRGGSGSVRLIAVNADETTAAAVTLPLNDVKSAKVLFGDGTAAATGDGLTITLPPMGTIVVTD